jgi:CheY-like chemotaxis protein
MPRLSGLSLLTNLGQTPNAETRIVMISALDDDSLRKQALASGASAYLVKPLTEDMLRDAMGDDFSTGSAPT